MYIYECVGVRGCVRACMHVCMYVYVCMHMHVIIVTWARVVCLTCTPEA